MESSVEFFHFSALFGVFCCFLTFFLIFAWQSKQKWAKGFEKCSKKLTRGCDGRNFLFRTCENLFGYFLVFSEMSSFLILTTPSAAKREFSNQGSLRKRTERKFLTFFGKFFCFFGPQKWLSWPKKSSHLDSRILNKRDEGHFQASQKTPLFWKIKLTKIDFLS